MTTTFKAWIVAGILASVAGCATSPEPPSENEATDAQKAARGVSEDVNAIEEFREAIELYEQQGDAQLGDVEKQLRKALKEDPNFGKAWFNLGVVLEKQGKNQAAREAYKKAHKAAPALGDPLVNLGMIALEEGNRQQAYEYFERALKAEQFDTTAHNNLSVKYRETGKWEKAVSHARQALAGDSQNVKAYANLARTYYQMEAYDPARLVLLNALELTKEQGSQKTYDADLHNLMGLVDLAQNDVSGAIGEFEKALKLEPDHVPVRMNLGAVMLNVRDFTESLEHFRRVLEQQPDNTEARISVAVAKRSMGKLEEARKIYETILEEQPKNAIVHFNMGVLEHEHLARNASKGVGREEAPRDPVAQMGWTIENMRNAVDHYEAAIKYYRNFLSYAGEKHRDLRKKVNERIGQVDKLMETTKEQIPTLIEQKKQLKKRMEKQKQRQQQSDGAQGGEDGAAGPEGGANEGAASEGDTDEGGQKQAPDSAENKEGAGGSEGGG